MKKNAQVFPWSRVVLLFILISILPFYRGCSSVTYGFPAVAFEGDLGRINFDGVLLNVVFIALLSLLFFRNIDRWWRKKSFRVGSYFFSIYHLLYIVTMILYVFDLLNIEIVFDVLVSLVAFPLYVFNELQFLWVSFLPLYPEPDDIPMRLSYLVSSMIYFFVGVGFIKIVSLFKK